MDDPPADPTLPPPVAPAAADATLPQACEVSPGIWCVTFPDGSEAYVTAGEAKRLTRKPAAARAAGRGRAARGMAPRTRE